MGDPSQDCLILVGLDRLDAFELAHGYDGLVTVEVSKTPQGAFGDPASVALILGLTTQGAVLFAIWLSKARKTRRIECSLIQKSPSGEELEAHLVVEESDAKLDSETLNAIAAAFKVPVDEIVKRIG